MKIAGKPLVSIPKYPLTLHRPDGDIHLQVSPFSPGFDSRMKMLGMLSFPAPPTRPLMNGKVPWKRSDGTVQTFVDEGDQAYIEKTNLVVERITALRVADALRGDPSVEFNSKPPSGRDKKEWERYADALVDEIHDPVSGFLSEEVLKILSTARHGRVDVDSEAAKDEFLGELNQEEVEDEAS